MLEAMAAHLAVLRDSGEVVPEPAANAVATILDVSAA